MLNIQELEYIEKIHKRPIEWAQQLEEELQAYEDKERVYKNHFTWIKKLILNSDHTINWMKRDLKDFVDKFIDNNYEYSTVISSRVKEIILLDASRDVRIAYFERTTQRVYGIKISPYQYDETQTGVTA